MFFLGKKKKNKQQGMEKYSFIINLNVLQCLLLKQVAIFFAL